MHHSKQTAIAGLIPVVVLGAGLTLLVGQCAQASSLTGDVAGLARASGSSRTGHDGTVRPGQGPVGPSPKGSVLMAEPGQGDRHTGGDPTQRDHRSVQGGAPEGSQAGNGSLCGVRSGANRCQSSD